MSGGIIGGFNYKTSENKGSCKNPPPKKTYVCSESISSSYSFLIALVPVKSNYKCLIELLRVLIAEYENTGKVA